MEIQPHTGSPNKVTFDSSFWCQNITRDVEVSPTNEPWKGKMWSTEADSLGYPRIFPCFVGGHRAQSRPGTRVIIATNIGLAGSP